LSRAFFFPLFLFWASLACAETAPSPSLVRVEFQWEAVEEAVGYHLEVSDDPKFTHILKVVDGESTMQSLELPLREKYFIRVAARDIDGELGPFAGTEVVLPPPKPEPVAEVPIEAPEPELEKVASERVVVPPSVLPWYLPTHVALGVGGWLRNEVVSGSDFSASNRGGIPAVSLGLTKQVGESDYSVEGDFGQLGYRARALSSQLSTANSTPSPEGERLRWVAARFFWKSYWGSASFPMTVGLAFANQADFYRLSDDSLTYRQVGSFAVLVGPTFSIVNERKYFSNVELLAELAPLGTSRGGGFLARARFGMRRLWGNLSPELQLLFHPSYYRIASPDRSFLRMDFGPTIFLSFAFEPERSFGADKILED
jgi:hypothetical protein